MMSKENTLPPSLEEIASANKSEFDALFANQMALDTTTIEVAESATPASPANDTPSVGPHITNLLQETYGPEWSHEIVEHAVEPNEVRVLCRLTVNGQSCMEFGTAINDGNIGICLQRATDDALARCHSNLAPETHAHLLSNSVSRTQQGRGLQNANVPGHGEDPSRIQRADTQSGDDISKSIPHRVEAALSSTIDEMEAVLLRGAMSAGIRNQRDFGCMIADGNGHLLAGRTECDLAALLGVSRFEPEPGDVILHSDPYGVGGAGGHLNDWVVVSPIFVGADVIGFSSSYGHMTDIGSPVPGSSPLSAQSIFGEGLRIPPIRLYSKGHLNHDALAILSANTRASAENHNDLLTLIASTRAGAARVIKLCARFGKSTYLRAGTLLMERSRQAMRSTIARYFPLEPQSFEDYVDDDGCGNGPFRIKVTIWRERDQAYLDWTGTDAQALGPVNLHLQESSLKHMVSQYLLRRMDPSMKSNSGGQSLLNMTLPADSLINATFPAALGNRRHSLSRLRDVLNGVFSHSTDELIVAGGETHHGLLTFMPAHEDSCLILTDTHYGGIPARPHADGIDGSAWKDGVQINSIEDMEHRAPIRIDSHRSIPDSGGQGAFRGGNATTTVYQFTQPGNVSISDDRQNGRPWGLFGGTPGAQSSKYLTKKGGERIELASKSEHVAVFPGDKLTYNSPGTGGWGDPLQRSIESVQEDVAQGLVSIKSAKEDYGVVIDALTGAIATEETEALRRRLQNAQRPRTHFDFGKSTERESG